MISGFDGTNAQEPLFIDSAVASIRDYPYQLSIYYGKNNVCGATIISPRWAITSSYCLRFKTPAQVNLRAGSNETQTGGTVYGVSAFYFHPKFNSTTGDYDAALLKLSRPFNYSRSVQSIPLVTSYKNIPIGTYGVVTGWGYLTNSGSVFSSTLRRVTMTVINSYSCSTAYPKKFNPSTMLCTQSVGSTKGLCSSAGYPLVVNGTLVGIFSSTTDCTRSPPIFTKLSTATIRSWISSVANA